VPGPHLARPQASIGHFSRPLFWRFAAEEGVTAAPKETRCHPHQLTVTLIGSDKLQRILAARGGKRKDVGLELRHWHYS